MASDVIESEAVLKGDMSLNNSTPDFVTPRTHGELENRQTPSPSSSGVSGEGDEEELDELQNSTVCTVEQPEEAQEGVIKTSGAPQERTTPDNEQKQTWVGSSTPVSLPQPRFPSGPIGRSVCVVILSLVFILATLKHQRVSGLVPPVQKILFSQTASPEPEYCLCSEFPLYVLIITFCCSNQTSGYLANLPVSPGRHRKATNPPWITTGPQTRCKSSTLVSSNTHQYKKK